MLSSRGRAGSARVLIVADDVSVTDAFSRALRLEGFEVWAALSGAEGLRLARKHLPHTVVLNLRMPIVSVVGLLRSLRAIPGLAEPPIGIVTGDYHMDDAHTHEIAALGGTLHFTPLWLDELVGLARNLVTAPLRD